MAIGGSENFYSAFQNEFDKTIPVVHASVGGCRIVGRLTVGNRHGLLVPNSTTDQELQVSFYSYLTSKLHSKTNFLGKHTNNCNLLQQIRNSLPDTVHIQRVEERLSALGNVIACNDYVALVHPGM